CGTLIATFLSIHVSWARYTVPNPPLPSGPMILYFPSIWPLNSNADFDAAVYRRTVRSGRLIVVETAPALLAEISGGNHAAQQRTGTILRIAETVVEDVEDREADVEADEVGQRQRAHRMIHAQLHHAVDRFRRSDAFHQRVDRLIDHRQQDAVRDEARVVGGLDPRLAEPHAQLRRDHHRVG